MIRYPVELRDKIFVDGYRSLPFAKNMSKNIGGNRIKNLKD